MTRHAVALSTRSRSGNAAPPCDTKSRGSRSACLEARASRRWRSPTCESCGQSEGLALNVASGQALLSVLVGAPAGSCGSVTQHRLDVGLRARGIGSLSQSAIAPFAREVFALEEAVSFGVNASALQPVAWNGVGSGLGRAEGGSERGVRCSRRAVGGVDREVRAVDVTVSVFRRSGTPPTIVGSWLETMIRAVNGSTRWWRA